MTTTVAAIAAEAFDAVAADLSGVIRTGTLTRKADAGYNPTTEAYTAATGTYTCRVVDASSMPVGALPPGFVSGPGEAVLFIEGLTVEPRKSDVIAYGSRTRTVSQVADIAGAGGLYAVVAA